jgi:CRISPR system Cascade subunit CasB
MDPKERATQVLGFLRRHKADRGAMANLRCALTDARRCRAWPLLGEIGGIGDTTVETVAGLYATHPEETDRGNLGSLYRTLSGENNTFEGRFKRLLTCATREEACAHLRPLVTAAKAKGFKVNYHQLIVDLLFWSENVRVGWARSFWGEERS